MIFFLLCGCSKSQPTLLDPNPETNAAPNEEERLHQPFDVAVSEDSPGNQQPPPDSTMAGLNTGRLRIDVQKAWDSIRFTNNGKPISYFALVDTDSGRFKVWLRADIAPNHVRNFIALARAGYYNGLVFEHLIQQPGDETPDSNLEMIEGGCPLGTGEPGIGHLGYWLRPEFSGKLSHEPGTLGAYHDENPESAACRIYITVTKAPAMDGAFTAFGQVVEGLDVVRTISKQPKVEGTVQAVKPTLIRSVTIETP